MHSICGQLSQASSFTSDFGDSVSWPFQDLVIRDQNRQGFFFPIFPHIIKILSYANFALSQQYPLSIWFFLITVIQDDSLKRKKKSHEFFLTNQPLSHSLQGLGLGVLTWMRSVSHCGVFIYWTPLRSTEPIRTQIYFPIRFCEILTAAKIIMMLE